MNLISFLFPQTVFKTNSPFSGKIKVIRQFGSLSIKAGGVEQSGPMVKGLWQKALKKIPEASNVLILGLGGGVTVGVVKNRWPKARVSGVEIDRKMIEIGERFFGFKENEKDNLRIIKDNAFERVKGFTKEKFDLILVDLYLGREFAKEAKEDQFLSDLKKIMDRKGTVIFNRLRTDRSENFEKKLKKHFLKVQVVKTAANLLFIASG